MQDMLANRYLLNGQADKAMRLYRQALHEQPQRTELACRLLLAHLDLAQLDEAATLIASRLAVHGREHLSGLVAGCQGFAVDPPCVGETDPALAGLRALLRGDNQAAERELARVEAARHPEVVRLNQLLKEKR